MRTLGPLRPVVSAMIDPLPLSVTDILAVRQPDRHDPTVPTPAEVLGYALGERLSRHADCVRYLEALARAGDRARTVSIGRSVEGRELVQLLVSSPRNLARLDELHGAWQELADPSAALPDLTALPLVIWVVANVHGGEHSSGEAALALAYQLVAGTDEASAAIREQAVVVIEPLQNPDGRDRSVNSYYSLHGVVANPDPHSAEHEAPWPGPRGSHYAFDLNRDWALLTHPESRARAASFLHWRPQVVLDLHEMGEDQSFYFPPPALPIEVNVAASLQQWWQVFGRANAAAFDQRGWDYFIGEVFDSHYPGYGETWPLFHGALGMTFEQARARTIAVRRPDGQLQTLADGVAHHFVASLTSCTTAVTNRVELLRHYREFQAQAVAGGAAGPRRALLLDAGDRAADAAEAADNLRQQGVLVRTAGEAFTVAVEPLDGGPTHERRLSAGSLVVPLDQPAARLIQALCAPRSPMPDDFVAEELERLRHRADANIYDITAWSLPHRYGLEAFWAAAVPTVAEPAAAVSAPAATMGYVVPAGTRATGRLAARLVSEEGWRLRVAQRPLRVNGRDCGRGSLVLRVRDHDADLHQRLTALVAETGADLLAADSAWPEAGLPLGSYHIKAVQPTRVAMLTRPPIAAQAAGWLAYLLEQQYRLTYTPLDAGALTARRLREYNVLLVPDGGGYERIFGGEATWLKSWVEAGGTLVTLGGGSSAWLCGLGDRFTTARQVTDLRGEEPAGEAAAKEKQPPVPAEHRPFTLPRLSAWVRSDRYSYLTYGCPGRFRVSFGGSTLFKPPITGHTVLQFEATAPVASGFAPGRMAQALAGTAYLWQERHGAGQVVCFADAPTFRASWPMLDRLWLNAALFGPSLERE